MSLYQLNRNLKYDTGEYTSHIKKGDICIINGTFDPTNPNQIKLMFSNGKRIDINVNYFTDHEDPDTKEIVPSYFDIIPRQNTSEIIADTRSGGRRTKRRTKKRSRKSRRL
jgi:hypothetical protein